MAAGTTIWVQKKLKEEEEAWNEGETDTDTA